jgi:hypothetical protein
MIACASKVPKFTFNNLKLRHSCRRNLTMNLTLDDPRRKWQSIMVLSLWNSSASVNAYIGIPSDASKVMWLWDLLHRSASSNHATS